MKCWPQKGQLLSLAAFSWWDSEAERGVAAAAGSAMLELELELELGGDGTGLFLKQQHEGQVRCRKERGTAKA